MDFNDRPIMFMCQFEDDDDELHYFGSNLFHDGLCMHWIDAVFGCIRCMVATV